MKTKTLSYAVLMLVVLSTQIARAVSPTADEMAQSRDWAAAHFEGAKPSKDMAPFFSFTYDGKPSAELLKTWELKRTSRQIDDNRTEHTLTYTDPKTQLSVRCVAIEYRGLPVVEWVLHFKNESSHDSPVISDIQALSDSIPAQEGESCIVHYANGGQEVMDAFAPREHSLAAPDKFDFGSTGGRSSNGCMPFFNLQTGGRGVIGAIGWSGNWTAAFQRGAKGTIQIQAGMQHTHLKLRPGEEIRSPRIMLLFWNGDRLHAHNLLRQFLLAYHTRLPKKWQHRLPIFFSAWGECRADDQIATAKKLVDNRIPVDAFWIDAGWYGDKPTFKPLVTDEDYAKSDWWRYRGSWQPNKITYPQGMKPIGDALRKWNLDFMLWFEPELAFRNSVYQRQHPEWLLGPDGDYFLVNLGLPEVRQALTDLISSYVTDCGMTCYRQDGNLDPETLWEKADTPDRVGMTEIRYVEGLYAFWDALLERHPDLLIDNCASGGRRIDLETISRSVAFWRSDYQCRSKRSRNGLQGQTYGISFWTPLSGGVVSDDELYSFRSALSPTVVLSSIDKKDPARTRAMVQEAKDVQSDFLGDYYPLTPYSLADTDWMAMQFHRTDKERGIVLAFRRPKCSEASLKVHLHGLDLSASYTLESAEQKTTITATGQSLMEEGIGISLPQRPGADLIKYRRAK